MRKTHFGVIGIFPTTTFTSERHKNTSINMIRKERPAVTGSHYVWYTVLSASLPAIRNPNVMYSGSLLLIAHRGALTNAGFPLTSPFLF